MKSSKYKHCAFADVANALFRQVPFISIRKPVFPATTVKNVVKLSAGTTGRTRNAPRYATGKTVIR